MIEAFRQHFDKRSPRFFVTAPGRINLIGEHTDYNGFPVMPMALPRKIRICAAPAENSEVVLHNLQETEYPPRRFEIGPAIPPTSSGDWSNYVRAAAQSLAGSPDDFGCAGKPRGMLCVIDGDIPPEAGLSSSSALVVGSALALAACNKGRETGHSRQARIALADRMAEAEHYVGTRGGGMDQAVCLLARDQCALKIDFFPLRAEPVPFPEGWSVLAAHSTRRSRKSAERRKAYNRRVAECRVGTELLARRRDSRQVERLADLCPDGNPGELEALAAELRETVGGREELPVRDAASLLGMSPDQFRNRFLGDSEGNDPRPTGTLKILPRCRHVLSEARRVEQAANALRKEKIERMGDLMNASHRSCAQDYEISSPELDDLVAIMREKGAVGSRLTGAGFGGFAIGLVRTETAPGLRAALDESFYRPRELSAETQTYLFRPAAGASVKKLGELSADQCV